MNRAEYVRDLIIGIGGTTTATMATIPEGAAAFAGFATGLWMLRQIWMSFRAKK